MAQDRTQGMAQLERTALHALDNPGNKRLPERELIVGVQVLPGDEDRDLWLLNFTSDVNGLEYERTALPMGRCSDEDQDGSGKSLHGYGPHGLSVPVVSGAGWAPGGSLQV